jgi:hypothetical protein
MRTLTICLTIVVGLTLSAISQPSIASVKTSQAVCSFDDGKSIKVEYSTDPPKRGEELRNGRLWEPGGLPMFLFTETPLSLGSSQIPDGAYSLYVKPEKQNWNLIVNKNVSAGSKYDPKQDLAHASMETGKLENPVKQLQVAFAHVAPKQCSIRLYYQNTWASVEFNER